MSACVGIGINRADILNHLGCWSSARTEQRRDLVPQNYGRAPILPVGITFFGPPFSEPTLLKLAYPYEQATHHRTPPPTVPDLRASNADPTRVAVTGN